MKKIISIFIVVVIALTMIIPSAYASDSSSTITLDEYDLNSDGCINAFDLLLLKKELLEESSDKKIASVVVLQQFLIRSTKTEAMATEAVTTEAVTTEAVTTEAVTDIGRAAVSLNLSKLEVSKTNTAKLLHIIEDMQYVGTVNSAPSILRYSFENEYTEVYIVASNATIDSNDKLLLSFTPTSESKVKIELYISDESYKLAYIC